MSGIEPLKVTPQWKTVTPNHFVLIGPNPGHRHVEQEFIIGNVRAGEGAARGMWFAHLGDCYDPISKNGCADVTKAKELVELFVLMPTTPTETER